ncbi:MAG: GWxTD domain-containing protein, partial [Candidatus Kapaibacterium sp.]
RPILDMNRTIALSGTVTRDVFEQQVHILPSGVYYVTAGIVSTDGTPAPTNQSTKKFYILNPAYPPELSDLFTEDQLFLASEFAAMSAEAIQEEYEKAKRVGPDIELVSFQQLSTLNAKQKFIFRYWYHKDPNPTTAVNERYEDFKKAVDYAKLNFSNPFTPRGWDSDRGRIVLRYGFPTNINRVIFNHDAAFPHETWEYDNIQGGVIFVFVDKRGSGNVTLVHSTALNEHRDDLWYRRYAIDPSQNK